MDMVMGDRTSKTPLPILCLRAAGTRVLRGEFGSHSSERGLAMAELLLGLAGVACVAAAFLMSGRGLALVVGLLYCLTAAWLLL